MATLQDIAEAAGVSRETVSRVLNGEHKGMRRDAVARARAIQDIARRLGYRPNAAATALARGRTQTIGLLYSGDSPLLGNAYGALTDGIARQLRTFGCSLQLVAVDADQPPADDHFLDRRFDGCLVHHDVSPGVEAALRRAGLPAVLINATAATPWPRVLPDDAQGMHMVLDHLLDLGHRHIVLLGYQMTGRHFSSDVREAAFRRGTAKAGVNGEVITLTAKHDNEEIDLPRLAMSLARRADRPTAMIVGNEHKLPTLLRALRHAKLDVPRDLSLAVFNDAPLQQALEITAVDVPFRLLGDRGASLLLESIDLNARVEEDNGASPRVLLVPEQLLRRSSTGLPRGKA
ncbi:MAG: LacI family DNA-binding transcriptional regulator [Phycisphaerae bacterium]